MSLPTKEEKAVPLHHRYDFPELKDEVPHPSIVLAKHMEQYIKDHPEILKGATVKYYKYPPF